MKNTIPRTLIDILPENIYWTDRDGKVLGCNHNQAKVFGLNSPEEIQGKDIFEIAKLMGWHDDIPNAVRKHDLQVMASKQGTIVEETGFWGGEYKHVLSYKEPWINGEGEVIGLVGMSVDITLRKKNEELQIHNKEIKNRANYIRTIAGAIAHDLRTPLASIKAAMAAIDNLLDPLIESHQMAVEVGLNVPSIRESRLTQVSGSVERSLKEVDFANNYIDMMLNNLKFDAIDTTRYKQFNIIKILEYTLETYPYLDNEQEFIHWHHPIDFNFLGDDFYLKNVINNLLKNAFYFIKKQNRGEIFIWTDEETDFNLLHIKDTAQGASPKILEQLFQPYFSTRQGGTGLGLVFSRSIMRSFGGEISAYSKEGAFMEFVLKFPKLPT